MTIESAIKILRSNGYDVIVTLEEYLLHTDTGYQLVSESWIKNSAKKLQGKINV